MSTTKGQRIGIWVIVVFMIVGTIGSFAIIGLANQNNSNDQSRIQKLEAQYQKEYKDYQAKLTAQSDELSAKYFDEFNRYSGLPAAFDAKSVTELGKEDLVEGDGVVLNKDSSFHAYYIGWTPDGKVFDGSIKDGALSSPIKVEPGGVIEGWTNGVDGMKVGGVRVLTIPSELAYGERGSGESIPANTPLKFVIMVIPSPEEVTGMPGIPQELYEYYQKQGMM